MSPSLYPRSLTQKLRTLRGLAGGKGVHRCHLRVGTRCHLIPPMGTDEVHRFVASVYIRTEKSKASDSQLAVTLVVSQLVGSTTDI